MQATGYCRKKGCRRAMVTEENRETENATFDSEPGMDGEGRG
jgi:hypothetical protein